MRLAISNRIPKEWNRDLMVALIKILENQINQLAEGALVARYQAMSAAPTTGTFAKGDIVWNSAPISGGFIGWVCVSAGTPGTWKTWGAIS